MAIGFFNRHLKAVSNSTVSLFKNDGSANPSLSKVSIATNAGADIWIMMAIWIFYPC